MEKPFEIVLFEQLRHMLLHLLSLRVVDLGYRLKILLQIDDALHWYQDLQLSWFSLSLPALSEVTFGPPWYDFALLAKVEFFVDWIKLQILIID